MALLLAEERFLKIKQAMREEQNQPGVMQELLLKLMDDLQILKGSQQEKKETTAQSFTTKHQPLNLECDSLEEENEDQEEKEFDLEDIFQIQDVILREHTEETRSGSTTTHANNSRPEYDSFLFEIEPDQGGLISVVISDNSNDPLLELPEFESFHFDLDPSFSRPPLEPPDAEISLIIETDAPYSYLLCSVDSSAHSAYDSYPIASSCSLSAGVKDGSSSSSALLAASSQLSLKRWFARAIVRISSTMSTESSTRNHFFDINF
ncbi:hypothetical protein Tco_0110352 [Tanacetum coccineum]